MTTVATRRFVRRRWVWDLRRETLTRLTFAAEADWNPVWTPDGRRVVFTSTRDSSVLNGTVKLRANPRVG